MKVHFFPLLVSALVLGSNATPNMDEGVNGGIGCAACTVVIALVEQLAEVNNATVAQTLAQLCNFFPAKFQPPCHTAVETLGPLIISLAAHNSGPDVACHALSFCSTDPGQPICKSMVPPIGHRYNSNSSAIFDEQVIKAKQHIAPLLKKYLNQGTPWTISGFCDVPGIKIICQWIDRTFSHEKPPLDLDKDLYGTFQGLRGTSWRGKDCADLLPNVHPGTRPINQDRHSDSNCNGIYGVNNKTQRSYEDELCSAYPPKGIAVLGDSISAHFHLPPQWLDATKITLDAFKHLEFVVENEIDWPMMSTVTGHGTNNWTEVITGPIDSIYLRLRDRNRCNHRDYQNIAHNGEDSKSMMELVKTLSRHPAKDYPILTILSLVGNDVCNGHVDTLAHMTTTEEMYNNTMNTLTYLGKILPKNSHVVLIGLADGRVLYDSVGQRVHPVSTYWGEFTYGKFYDFMNCLQISPCKGWMTTNETLRNLTSERAGQLTDVLRTIYKNHKNDFQNFDLLYLDNPIAEVLIEWQASGGQVWQLIEPSDGFHINQEAQALTAKVIWKELENNHPEFLGPINPNNINIEKIFGDQGGY